MVFELPLGWLCLSVFPKRVLSHPQQLFRSGRATPNNCFSILGVAELSQIRRGLGHPPLISGVADPPPDDGSYHPQMPKDDSGTIGFLIFLIILLLFLRGYFFFFEFGFKTSRVKPKYNFTLKNQPNQFFQI
jgi:hypothetical protein